MFDELQLHLLAVQVAVEIEDERLDDARSVLVEGGLMPDAHGCRQAVRAAQQPPRVDAVRRNRLLRLHAEVGRGVAEQPAAPVLALHDRAFQRERTPQHARGVGDVARFQRLPYCGAAGGFPVERELLDALHRVAEFVPQRGEHRERPLPVVTEGDVRPSGEVSHAEAVPQRSHELAGREQRHLLRERDGHDRIDA